jgi:hypothetical protein
MSLTLNSGTRRFAEVSTSLRESKIGKRTPIHTVTHSPYMYIKIASDLHRACSLRQSLMEPKKKKEKNKKNNI